MKHHFSTLSARLRQALLRYTQYKKYKTTVAYYETEALKNVDLVLATANKKFIGGDINYLEWVMLINQNTEIQSNYVEAVKQLNNTIIQLNSLTNK